MSENRESVKVKCPYYLDEDKKSICCERILPKTKFQNHHFNTQLDKTMYKEVFCNNIENHLNCEIYITLTKSYNKRATL